MWTRSGMSEGDSAAAACVAESVASGVPVLREITISYKRPPLRRGGFLVVGDCSV